MVNGPVILGFLRPRVTETEAFPPVRLSLDRAAYLGLMQFMGQISLLWTAASRSQYSGM